MKTNVPAQPAVDRLGLALPYGHPYTTPIIDRLLIAGATDKEITSQLRMIDRTIAAHQYRHPDRYNLAAVAQERLEDRRDPLF